ncbi:phosphoribosylanthranilate isomerase [Rhodoligotrophos defluvii]|uniref:phosphoribosylanthranilate isomerase n=1 Tax=Rhodoligotrophos defluvii TaxID=2561934 RepID=UPI0010C99295|nr:phosphoribosylanthranilate isomerase [Rhodoligotrophos defluvii]
MSVRVKICGISEPATLQAALEAGADMVGFVFYARSPRNVTIAQAASLAALVGRRARKVVLTVDADDAAIAAIGAAVSPDFIQAHGAESPERVAEIAERFGVPVIKAVRVSGADAAAEARSYRGAAEMVLFDAAPPRTAAALPGGNGIAFDWSLLAAAKPEGPFVLSGGLDADNVGEAIRLTGAPIVDVSSGVETAPGRKDAALIRNFIEAAKAAG